MLQTRRYALPIQLFSVLFPWFPVSPVVRELSVLSGARAPALKAISKFPATNQLIRVIEVPSSGEQENRRLLPRPFYSGGGIAGAAVVGLRFQR